MLEESEETVCDVAPLRGLVKTRVEVDVVSETNVV